MEDFSALLKRYRNRAGLSQSELARRAGISASYVNRLEEGERQPPSRSVVLQISEALRLDSTATDALVLAAGYARERQAVLSIEHPILGLMADILQDDHVPEEELELLRLQLELMKRRWNPQQESQRA